VFSAIPLSSRFERLGKTMDVTESISMSEKSVSLSPIDHPNNLDCLTNLGNPLFRRFERLGEVDDKTTDSDGRESLAAHSRRGYDQTTVVG
jgi:hypothetical protein